MVVLRREESWSGRRRRLGVAWRRIARLGTPVLVVAAALFGAGLSATVLVGFWGKEAGRRQAAQTRLAAAAERSKALADVNARLNRQLGDSRATSTQLEQVTARLQAAAQQLLRQNASLVASASRLHGRSGSLERRAASVSKLADTLGSDLVAVLSYVTNTSSGSLDPAYLKAQLDYLRPAVASVRSAAEALDADAGSYGAAVDGLAGEAASYAAALRRLAREQPSGGSHGRTTTRPAVK